MKVTFKSIDLPFTVGDTVFVNQSHGERLPGQTGPRHPYFQAEIQRIFLDGRLEEISVITEPLDTYELEIRTVVYDLKPIGSYEGLVKMPLKVDLPIKEPKLFRSEAELVDYVRSLSEVEDKITPTRQLEEDERS